MNEILVYLAPVAVLLALAARVLPLLQVRRLAAEQRSQLANLQAIQRDLRALAHSAVTVGERVGRLEQGAKGVEKRLETLGLQQEKLVKGDKEEYSFEQAIKLAQKGSDVESLIELTGLSRGEAELVAMMHRLDKVQD